NLNVAKFNIFSALSDDEYLAVDCCCFRFAARQSKHSNDCDKRNDDFYFHGFAFSLNSNAKCPNRPSQTEYRKRVPVRLRCASTRQVRLHLISVIAKLRAPSRRDPLPRRHSECGMRRARTRPSRSKAPGGWRTAPRRYTFFTPPEFASVPILARLIRQYKRG